ncbi:MAG: type II toxin-antitoxin system VapC family toxin [Clostridia bacterium]|nr:type II toxin-antitoxin system VapC family toxin [Clostridia bacterium]
MMLLLDTHALIWLFSDSCKIPAETRIAMMENDLCVSMASLWEIGIKASLKKEEKRLNIKRSIVEIAGMCDIQGIDIIPITPEACEAVKALPHIHEDPFDRMIIAQAMLGGMELVTKDENIWKYPGVRRIW